MGRQCPSTAADRVEPVHDRGGWGDRGVLVPPTRVKIF